MGLSLNFTEMIKGIFLLSNFPPNGSTKTLNLIFVDMSDSTQSGSTTIRNGLPIHLLSRALLNRLGFPDPVFGAWQQYIYQLSS